PRIVLPDSVLREFSFEQLEMILLHELAHVRRHDMLIRESIFVLRIVHWFNPAAWWAFHRMEVEREIACDELVLDVTGADRRQSYGLTLLNVAQRDSAPVLSPGLLGASDKSTRLQRRLAMIRDYRARSWKMTLLGVVVIVVTSAVGLTNPPAVNTTEATQTTEAPQTTETPDGTVDEEAPEAQSDEPADGSSNPASKTSFEVKGRCLDDEGNPLKEAEVVLFLFDSYGAPPTQTWRRQTGASGEYRFGDLKPLSEVEGRSQSFCVAGRKPKYASSARMIFVSEKRTDFDLTLASNSGTLSGRVTNEREEPLARADVFLPTAGVPLPGFMNAVTDKDGRFAIPDLKCWNAKDTETFDPKTGFGTVVSQCYIYVKHADYPLTRGGYSGIPQEVDVQLKPGMIIEGRVVDIVTGRLAAGAVVSAQGNKEHGWAQVTADENGEYRLVLNADQYNIWAQTNDRTSVALNSFTGPTGKTTRAPDLELISGGIIAGKVVEKTTGKPLSKLPNGQHLSIGHHGPAFPKSGAAVGVAAVAGDGSYRLRVAPGANYPYLMHLVDAERTPRNATALEPIIVREGETVTLDFHVGAIAEDLSQARPQPRTVAKGKPRGIAAAITPREDSPAARHGRRSQPRDTAAATTAREADSKPEVDQPIPRRRDTVVGKLLDQLDELRPNGGQDEWAQVLRDLIEIGPEAVPELIDEMDATNDEYMLRCLGFVVRGIGDERVIPALIRALPKTCEAGKSDMGYIAKDPELLSFMQKHEMSHLNTALRNTHYSIGRPVNELRVALQKLSGTKHGEDEIVHVILEGTPRQRFLQRSLYQRCAERWAAWWEMHWKEHTDDERYAHVNLAPLADEPNSAEGFPHGPQARIKVRHSNHILESVRDPKARWVFHDFDTGRISELPADLRVAERGFERLDDILAWASREGFDVMGTEYTPPGSETSHYVLRGLGLTAWQIETDRWNSLETEVRSSKPLKMGTRTDGLLARFDAANGQYVADETATFLFQTREGGYGAIFVEVEVHDDRFKPEKPASDDDNVSPISKGRRFAYTLINGIAANGTDRGN
ncbi:MAG TPA: M56 family metallopeptidase, partial [Pirellulales bacterium]|nr:M56 family metallopeptidase [Pirellulales bacterium]